MDVHTDTDTEKNRDADTDTGTDGRIVRAHGRIARHPAVRGGAPGGVATKVECDGLEGALH